MHKRLSRYAWCFPSLFISVAPSFVATIQAPTDKGLRIALVSYKVSEILNRLGQTFLQRNFRFPAKEFLGEGDVGFAALRIIGGDWAIDELRP